MRVYHKYSSGYLHVRLLLFYHEHTQYNLVCKTKWKGGRPSLALCVDLESFSSSLLLSSLELGDTKVSEPHWRALFGTASLFCEVVVPKFWRAFSVCVCQREEEGGIEP